MAITHTHKNSVSKQKHSVDKHDVRVCKYADENRVTQPHLGYKFLHTRTRGGLEKCHACWQCHV